MSGDAAPTTRSAPATLHDVAREAGVSLATASRSLNGSTRKVTEEYSQSVLAAAAKDAKDVPSVPDLDEKLLESIEQDESAGTKKK